MKAEHLNRPDQRAQALRGQGAAMVGVQRLLDGAQIVSQFFRQVVGVLRGHGVGHRLGPGQRLQGCCQARVHADQRAPVGFVGTVGVAVRAALGQRLHLRTALGQEGGYRQLAAQVMQLGQVVAQYHFALAAQGVFQGLCAHIGVAIAVTANPLAHAQKAVRHGMPQVLLNVGVDFGYFAQKGRFVIAQRVFHLVGYGQLAIAQQAGLP